MMLLAVLAAILLGTGGNAALASGDHGPTIDLDQQSIDATVGQAISVESSVANPDPAPTQRMIAHLNVASLDGRYVDLEDWSSDVTRPVEPLQAGRRVSVDWEFQAVNNGSFAVYVTLVPATGHGKVVASAPLHITVVTTRTLNVGGVLPVVLGMPGLWALAAVATTIRYRRGGLAARGRDHAP
jgi:hypothetical protein